MEKVCQIVACGVWATADSALDPESDCKNIFDGSILDSALEDPSSCKDDKYAFEVFLSDIRDSCS